MAVDIFRNLIPIDEIAADNADLALVLKTLGDVNRLRIFALLRNGERCVCDIEAETRLSQNLVSHHLRALREAGLIECRRDGRWAYYAVNRASLPRLQGAVHMLFDPTTIPNSRASC